MSQAHMPFRQAVEAGDLDALGACFTPEAVFHSPVRRTPFQDHATVMTVLRAVVEMFENFRYVDVFHNGRKAALFFEAQVGDRGVEGVDYLTFRSDGLVTGLTVMIRPLTALNAVAEDMGRRLSQK